MITQNAINEFIKRLVGGTKATPDSFPRNRTEARLEKYTGYVSESGERNIGYDELNRRRQKHRMEKNKKEDEQKKKES